MHIVIISLVMDFSGLVLAEAVLSYVGIGVDATTVSFGMMILAAARQCYRATSVSGTPSMPAGTGTPANRARVGAGTGAS